MSSIGGTGPGSPMIAGAGMAGGDFHDFSDDELATSNFFDFSNSADTLQSLETIGAADHKAFLSPQELTAPIPFPDSPNDSYHDSSSESAASSKRTTSCSTSTKLTPAAAGDVPMDESHSDKMEWGHSNFSGLDTDDSAFTFGRAADASGPDGMYTFGEHDDSFMEQSFDFESASSSPDAPSNGHMTNSPGMSTLRTHSPRLNHSGSVGESYTHKKRSSQFSASSLAAGGKASVSREVSPMSTLVTSHGSSPTALFNSPSPHTIPDFNGIAGSNGIWPSKLDLSAPSPLQFGSQIMQPIQMSQQLPLVNPPSTMFAGRYELRILPTPLKSRVETQIPIKMALCPLPPGVTKLHLPAHTISKPKLLAKPPPEPSADTLELHVGLVCTSAMQQPGMKRKALERAAVNPQGYLPDLDEEANLPQNGGDVRICNGCITRERKRAARKKIKKPEEEKMWSQDEERRVIVFNTQEVKEWQPLSAMLSKDDKPDPVASKGAMQIDAPMRIACYCRHHGEKMGFNVIFTIKDYQGRVIAQAMSNPIMITDDHKTHPMAQLATQPAPATESTNSVAPPDVNSLASNVSNGGFSMPVSAADLSTVTRASQGPAQGSVQGASSGKTTPTMSTTAIPSRALSRPASPGPGGPTAKRRKGSGSRVPNDLTMTRLDTSPAPAPRTASTHMSSISSATSPFSPNQNIIQPPESMFGQPNGQAPFATGPPTPSGNDQPAFFGNHRSASMDNLAMAQLYSAPASNHPSRAPSPNGLRNGIGAVPQNHFTQALASSLYSLPIGLNQTHVPPVIHKIIPNEGPKMGGIEVTVLGAAFFQGLEVWFGDRKATTTTYWGESSLVCLLPPSPVAGAVAVTFKHQAGQAPQNFPMAKQPPVFKYIDDNEDKLIRTALSVLGHKMSGQMVDVSDLARRILHDGNSSWTGGSSAGPSSNGSIFGHNTSSQHLETQLLKCLDLIDLDDSTHRTRLDLKRSTGHTMLHLACSLGYHRLVAALLARGANPDARDRGGFTPLHMAAIQSHSEIVRRLMLAGADPTIRSLSSLTAADVAQSRTVLRAIRSSQRHVRSRSGSSLHSRTSSAASLRSLWEPMTKVNTHDEPIIAFDSGEESPEYTSGDFEDEDPDENMFIGKRRPSGLRTDKDRVATVAETDESIDDGLASPTAALTVALKEQFQQQLHQLQQSMTIHLQNLPHFPQMPQMPQMPNFPGMPMFPDYQGYLQQAPFMRRMQQLMPGMNAARPGADEGTPHQKMDGRWWDFSSYVNTAAAPPPAYEDIFPQKDLDQKQASAAQAAAEAEADMKCASLYDQPGSMSAEASVAVAEERPTSTVVPDVLKIGRKNAITREQQEHFLKAREQKLKRISSDRNLFFVWIPLLLLVMCAMLYNYFPSFILFLWNIVRAVVQVGRTTASGLVQHTWGRVPGNPIENGL
ncbi:Protein MGA2 [Paramyrothecium foliicola]|nr:Protein MGA2 [Paramyrothecium foliicola]